MSNRNQFATEGLGKLLQQQAIPASIGILIMSIYGIVDTFFVGRWVGANGIGAITVVLPITYLIASIGMSIGVGGASIISRALGDKNPEKAHKTFANQVILTLVLAILIVSLCYVFIDYVLFAFGGKGEIKQYARDYFEVILFGIPFLAWAMMSNNVIRAEGFPKVAMFILIVPAVANIILDPILIVGFDMGIKGAAWATTLSYIASASYAAWFFLFGKSDLKLKVKDLVLNWPIIREIASIGSVTLARQGTISVLAMVLNNSLFFYGGEMGLSIYGIINRLMLFINFPVLGITQGFVPIVGFNYGAKLWDRVAGITNLSMKTASMIAFGIFIMIMILAPKIAAIFTEDAELIARTAPAMRLTFLATPLLAISLLGSAYFQAIGKALPALLLALTKQGFFLIPLVLILPLFFGLNGIWYSFPIADIGAAAISYYYIQRNMKKLKLEIAAEEVAPEKEALAPEMLIPKAENAK
ncbi:MAG: MATE family efflux transporter [Bacteroidia bacterium]|nr:MATE family efflux transporter [Bacteroidia bacterium]